MPRVAANSVELEYEQFGKPGDPPLVLIMGLSAQMILWEDDFCRELAARGFYVTRFDNRDVGKSTWLREAGFPDIAAAVLAAMTGQPVQAAYTLSDMAADTVGLMDALGIARAHLVGASMGGMIAQTVAIEHPSRVLTLTSIMSTTGDPSLPPSTPEATAALLAPLAKGRQENIDRVVEIFRIIGSPGFAYDENGMRDIAARSYDRGFHPDGAARQLAAILASGSRRERLAAVSAPTVVIHGKADPLVTLEGGVATAEAIPGAKLVAIDGMGHDMPRATWPILLDAISEVASRAKP